MKERGELFAAAAGAVYLLPRAALAAEGGAGYSLLGSFLQMLAALAVVVGLILLFYHFSNRWLKNVQGGFGVPRYIRLVETRYLAPKKALLLVETGGEYLLLASAGDRLTFIKQIDMLEEIEVVEVPGEARPLATAFRDKLQELLQKGTRRADQQSEEQLRRGRQ